MPAHKRPRKTDLPDSRKGDEPERVSLDPLDPVTALKGLLATPAPDQKPVKSKPKRKP